MPRFIVERTVDNISMEMLEQVTRRSREVMTDMSGVRWIRSFVSEAEGKFYCEYDAPAEDGFELYFPDYESLLQYCRKKFKRWNTGNPSPG